MNRKYAVNIVSGVFEVRNPLNDILFGAVRGTVRNAKISVSGWIVITGVPNPRRAVC